MLLDRIDIDAHGPLHRVELGPFAEHLNVVCGPEGSGKTAIVRFIRDSLVNREYPLGMMSSSTGRIVWADGNGLIHCRREKDGTSAGRTTVEFESRGDDTTSLDSLGSCWVANGSAVDSTLTARSIQLPESLVDGVITDTAVTNVARVVSACIRNGLDSPETYRSLPLASDSVYHDRNAGIGMPDSRGSSCYQSNRQLRSELAEVEAELSRLDTRHDEDESLIARRNELMARLTRSRHPAADHDVASLPYREWHPRFTELNDRTRQLRARQDELRRWIAEIDNDLGSNPSPDNASAYDRPLAYQHLAAISDDNLRRQLDDLDAQMIRWRRALLEVRGLRQTLVHGRDHFVHTSYPTLDEFALRRMRLDGFLHAVDRYDRSQNWDDLYRNDLRPLRHIDDIDARIESAVRHIDWLLDRYAGPASIQHAWFETIPASAIYESDKSRVSTTLGDRLRAIREELRHVRHYAMTTHDHAKERIAKEREELRHSEEWLVAAIEGLNRHRETLLHEYAATHKVERAGLSQPSGSRFDHFGLRRERNERVAELDRITAALDACLSEAAEVRRSMRSLPVIGSVDSPWRPKDWLDRDAITSELRRINQRLLASSRASWLRTRRSQLTEQLRVVQTPVPTQSPLADAASRWLVRLSAGRLRRVEWPYQSSPNSGDTCQRDPYNRTGVTINARDEAECTAADRAITVMAIRLAAGELLSQIGRPVPLVFETHREMFVGVSARRSHDGTPLAYFEHGDHARSNHPIATALRDYAHRGQQVVVLTSHQELADQLTRAGARGFKIFAERLLHPHRPLWRPHYEPESYVGPYAHTYGERGADEVMDINRDFDMAWRDAYGFYDNPNRIDRSSVRTDWARDGVDFRDGYYFANSYTTERVSPVREARDFQATQSFYDDGKSHWSGHSGDAVSPGPRANSQDSVAASAKPASPLRVRAAENPFLLSVDSPIDQAPSIDAVAAARLRGLSVTHINHLMQQDSNRLADALGLANVDAATIRRWQAECRLVCRVPQLRGFDARVLVGCGISTPAQLASIHPVDLLQKVESFLPTDRGQQLLLSGNSHELARLTSWIAAANSSQYSDVADFESNRSSRLQHGDRGSRSGRRSYDRGPQSTRHTNQVNGDHEFDSERYEYEDQDSSENNSATPGTGRGKGRGSRSTSASSSGSASRSGSGRARRRRSRRNNSDATQRDVVRYEREHSEREPRQRRESDSERELRFYLQRDSPVVDAPSIGARMAERLNGIGIYTVEDLLQADPETVAAELAHRRVDADTVLQWQLQSTLVCRVPMLRGHDAQLLVAAEVTTPEELADQDAEELLGIIDPIAKSSEGKRIVRGGKLPDFEEVTQWIAFAQHHRELRAA